jgi:hypothetical protein
MRTKKFEVLITKIKLLAEGKNKSFSLIATQERLVRDKHSSLFVSTALKKSFITRVARYKHLLILPLHH